MSHHRETVHAEGAPKAAGTYSHAVSSNGLIFLSPTQPKTVQGEAAPKAAGPYSHAVISSGLIFLSGQTPVDPATGELVEGSIRGQTRPRADHPRGVAR